MKLSGVIIPSLTPMQATGQRLNLAAIEPLVGFLVSCGVHGLFVGGTTGEGPLLTSGERKEQAEAVIAAVARRLPVIVQVGSTSTRESMALARHAVTASADAVACMTPTFFAYSDAELERFFLDVARAAAPLEFYLYNIPARTGNALSAALARRLACEANVVGIKDSSGDMAHLLELLAIPDFTVVIGADLLATLAFQAGATGMVSGPAGVMPEPYTALWKAHEKNDLAAMSYWQGVIMKISRLVHHGGRIDVLKALITRRIPEMGGVRPPQSPTSSEELEAIRGGLKSILQETPLQPEAYAWL